MAEPVQGRGKDHVAGGRGVRKVGVEMEEELEEDYTLFVSEPFVALISAGTSG